MNPRLAIGLAALFALFSLPASASAETFCVHSPPDCVGTSKAKLQDALNSAAANGSSRDTIYVGVGLFNDGKSTNVVGSPVDIIGVAANKTAMTASAGVSPILEIAEPTSEIKDLRVHAITTSGTTTGIYLSGTARDVMVTNQAVGGQFDGVRMIGSDAVFRTSSVSLVYPANLQDRAVFVSSGAEALISDSYLEGSVGVASAGSTFTVTRTRIRADQGVVVGGGVTGTVRDTAISVPGPMDSNFQLLGLAAAGSGNATLNATRVSAYTEETGTYGVWSVPNGGAGNNSSATVKGSLFHGFTTPFRESAGMGGATSTINLTGYSAYDFTKTGPEVPEAATDFNLNGVDPRIDTNSQVLATFFDSPLVDAGDPATGTGFLFFDVNFMARVRDGNGDGTNRIDIGAFEYQHRPPTAVAVAAPATADVGVDFTFDGSSSSDFDYTEGNTLAYEWAFDDGATETGETVTHAFDSGGDHTATLTVTDLSGLSSTATVVVTAISPDNPGDPGDPGDPGNPPDPTQPMDGPPTLSDLSLKRKRIRPAKGTTINYRLTEPADVTFTIHRGRKGRKVNGKCRKPNRRNREFKRCLRWKKVGSFVRPGLGGSNAASWDGLLNGKALRRGRYRLTARATDSTGKQSNRQRVRFRIVKPRASV